MDDPYNGKYCKDCIHCESVEIEDFKDGMRGFRKFRQCKIPRKVFHPVHGKSETLIRCTVARTNDGGHGCKKIGELWEKR